MKTLGRIFLGLIVAVGTAIYMWWPKVHMKDLEGPYSSLKYDEIGITLKVPDDIEYSTSSELFDEMRISSVFFKDWIIDSMDRSRLSYLFPSEVDFSMPKREVQKNGSLSDDYALHVYKFDVSGKDFILTKRSHEKKIIIDFYVVLNDGSQLTSRLNTGELEEKIGSKSLVDQDSFQTIENFLSEHVLKID